MEIIKRFCDMQLNDARKTLLVETSIITNSRCIQARIKFENSVVVV